MTAGGAAVAQGVPADIRRIVDRLSSLLDGLRAQLPQLRFGQCLIFHRQPQFILPQLRPNGALFMQSAACQGQDVPCQRILPGIAADEGQFHFSCFFALLGEGADVLSPHAPFPFQRRCIFMWRGKFLTSDRCFQSCAFPFAEQ